MYESETILSLKEPRDPDPETGEAFPYNRVRVVGESPVSHADKGDWKGADARGVIVVPLTNFGSTLDEPFGKLRTIYDVESIPEHEAPAEVPIKVIKSTSQSAGPTPEEVFAEKAPGARATGDHRRARTSPLGDPGGPPDHDGPLGKVHPESEVVDTGVETQTDLT
jgi:hypothetical protein